MAIEGNRTQIGSEAIATVQSWFNQMQTVPAAVRKFASQDARDMFEAFKAAGIERAEQIASGESVQMLMEKTGKTVDGLVSAMRQCPFGKQMPAVESPQVDRGSVASKE